MLPALILHILAIPAFGMYLLFAVPAEGWRHVWKRLPLFFLLWLAFALLTVLHVVGHLLDELLFRSYRRTPVTQPVFILGIPRSGTTYLHRLLGHEPRFTTFTTWETLFSPSITGRHLFKALGWLLRPLHGLVITVRRKVLREMDKVHRIRLNTPEEDFLLLLPLLGCLLPAFACPRARHFWRLGRFDQSMPAWYRATVMRFYYRCLQKHLFFHGGNLRFLSKNPSFTALLDSLLDTFPDAKIIACTRKPAEVVPSQLSSLRPAMAVLGNGKLSPLSQNRLIDILHHYYKKLATSRHNHRVFLLPMTVLQSDTRLATTRLFSFLELEPSDSWEGLVADQLAAGKHTSHHRYSLSEFSLSNACIEQRFGPAWAALCTVAERLPRPD